MVNGEGAPGWSLPPSLSFLSIHPFSLGLPIDNDDDDAALVPVRSLLSLRSPLGL